MCVKNKRGSDRKVTRLQSSPSRNCNTQEMECSVKACVCARSYAWANVYVCDSSEVKKEGDRRCDVEQNTWPREKIVKL